MRKIAIRIDDVCPKMDFEKFKAFEKILDKHDIKPLIGVVPDCKDSELNVDAGITDYKSFLNDKVEKGWSIAMHGYEHLYSSNHRGLFPLNSYSEFAGVSYKEQYHKISEGKKMLQKLGLEPEIFMAPAHTYDKNTIKALKKNGFEYITDGYGKDSYEYHGIRFITISLLRSRELKGKDGATTFVVHPATMSKADLEYYDRLFTEHRQQFINYSERLERPFKHRSAIGALSERGAANLKHLIGLIRK